MTAKMMPAKKRLLGDPSTTMESFENSLAELMRKFFNLTHNYQVLRQQHRKQQISLTEKDVKLREERAKGRALTQELKKAKREVTKAREIEPKTKLYNLRGFNHHLMNLIKDAKGNGNAVAMIFIDIDDFKLANSVHGHVVADRALKSVAKTIRDTVRPLDVVGRFGGEEIVVGAEFDPEKTTTAYIIGERIRTAVSDHCTIGTGNKKEKVTVSVGVVHLDVQDPNLLLTNRRGSVISAAIHQASLAMKEAKTRGKNRTVFNEASPTGRKTSDPGQTPRRRAHRVLLSGRNGPLR